MFNKLLRIQQLYCHVQPQNLMTLLRTRINLSGPISVAEYMKMVLTSQSGYYMINDVFGKEGDFITSPEISQMFGEMIGVWSLNELMKLGSPRPLQIVELGPGRGSMTQDILKVFKKFNQVKDISVHLVEVSPTLSKIQCERLCEKSIEVSDKPYYREGTDTFGVPIYWYRNVKDLPSGQFSLVFANEFFDALPIHKFQKTSNGWRELLIDVDDSPRELTLKFVLANGSTPGSLLLNNVDDKREHLEICPDAWVVMEHLADKFERFGGMALVVDYGHSGEKTDTFRAFKNHKLHDPLIAPGSADLTADVDFSHLKGAVKDKLITFGPVTQSEFFKKLHIEKRLEVLVNNCRNNEEKKKLISCYNLLMSKDQMGERFKVMSFFPAVLSQFRNFTVEGF